METQRETRTKIELTLADVNLKTVLIYPPHAILRHRFCLTIGLPYSTALLRGYLLRKGYSGVCLVDFWGRASYLARHVNKSLTRVVPEKLYSFIMTGLLMGSKLINSLIEHIILAKKPEADRRSLSLKDMIHVAERSPIANESPIFRRMEALMRKEKPGLVGFSIQYHSQLLCALQLSKVVRHIRPEAFIVFGGPNISKNISYLTQDGFVGRNVDGFVVNDGEEPLAELVRCLNNSGDLQDVPNLYYRADGEYCRSKRTFTCRREHLETEPVYSSYPFSHMLLRISQGCYWKKCAFCTYRLIHRQYAVMRADSAASMIQNLARRYKVRRFFFVDDALPPFVAKSVSEAICERKLKISWWCMSCLDKNFLKEDIPRHMAKAGCRKIRFGLESMSPRVLQLMGKMHRPENVLPILKRFREAGIHVEVFVMFGFPTETREEAQETLEFLKEHGKGMTIMIQPFTLEEDTIVYQNPSAFGIKKIYADDKCAGHRVGFRYEVEQGMTPEEAKVFTEEARKALGKRFDK